MNTDTTTNYYEVLHKLELLKKEINEVSDLKKIEEPIHQLKNYIFSIKELKDTYIKRVNEFADFLPSGNESTEILEDFRPNKEFTKEFEDTYINTIIENSTKEPNYCTTIRFLFYYPFVINYIPFDIYLKDFPKPTGIVSLYRNLYGTKLDKKFISKYKEILEAIDFYLLKLFDVVYIFPYEDQSFPLFNIVNTNAEEKKFLLLYIKALCNGVIQRLCIKISRDYIKQYYNENVQKSIMVQNVIPQELLNLSEQEKKVYLAFYKNPHYTVAKVSEQVELSDTYINNIITKCCDKLGLEETNLTALRDYINCHK